MIKGKNHLQYPKNILTVENLTSFSRNDFQNKDVFIFYLGGFSNHIKCEFLKTLYSYYPDSHYYHFGDIDCGVFKIWKNLIERTSIPFKTLSMDLNTLMTHSQFCKELTVNDYKTLTQMKDDPFFIEQSMLFDHMLSYNIKLEQECIKLNFDSLI